MNALKFFSSISEQTKGILLGYLVDCVPGIAIMKNYLYIHKCVLSEKLILVKQNY
jgi:hypothetical protein